YKHNRVFAQDTKVGWVHIGSIGRHNNDSAFGDALAEFLGCQTLARRVADLKILERRTIRNGLELTYFLGRREFRQLDVILGNFGHREESRGWASGALDLLLSIHHRFRPKKRQDDRQQNETHNKTPFLNCRTMIRRKLAVW